MYTHTNAHLYLFLFNKCYCYHCYYYCCYYHYNYYHYYYYYYYFSASLQTQLLAPLARPTFKHSWKLSSIH